MRTVVQGIMVLNVVLSTVFAIYSMAVDNRVYLFDQHKIQKRKEQARRAALEKVGAAVFNSQDGKNWKNKAKKDKSGLFRDDEKESMDVYDDEDYANDEDFED